MTDSLFVPDGDLFVPTSYTVGPWDSRFQHGGPPAALLGRTIEKCEERPQSQIVRTSFEIMRPIPLKPLRAEARLVRPGRSVEFLEGSLSDDEGVLMRASAWRIRTEQVDVAREVPVEPAPPGPESGVATPRLPVTSEFGYSEAMELRFVEGGFMDPGPATAWFRMRIPLLPDEEPSPLTRVLSAADSGNGISMTIDFTRYLFINVDLTVHLFRLPGGEWVGLKSTTYIGPQGIGLADTTLYDEKGNIGTGQQSLMVGPRRSPG